MITKKMTYSEIRNELVKDKMEVARFVVSKIKGYHKMFRSKKYNISNVHRFFEFTSKRNNKYIHRLIIKDRNLKEQRSHIFCEYYSNNDLMIAILDLFDDSCLFYSNKCLQEYNQSLNLELTSNSEIISHFISNNPNCSSTVIDTISEEENVYQVLGVINNGILEGIVNDKEDFATFDNFSIYQDMTDEERTIFYRLKVDSYTSFEKSLI